MSVIKVGTNTSSSAVNLLKDEIIRNKWCHNCETHTIKRLIYDKNLSITNPNPFIRKNVYFANSLFAKTTIYLLTRFKSCTILK